MGRYVKVTVGGGRRENKMKENEKCSAANVQTKAPARRGGGEAKRKPPKKKLSSAGGKVLLDHKFGAGKINMETTA